MPYGKLIQSEQSMGMGRACPAILSQYFTEKCHEQLLKWVRVSKTLVDQLEESGWHRERNTSLPDKRTISSSTWVSRKNGRQAIRSPGGLHHRLPPLFLPPTDQESFRN